MALDKAAVLKQVEDIIAKHGKAAAVEIGSAIAFPLLEQVVQESGNKIDDLVLAALEPQLKDAYQKLFS